MIFLKVWTHLLAKYNYFEGDGGGSGYIRYLKKVKKSNQNNIFFNYTLGNKYVFAFVIRSLGLIFESWADIENGMYYALYIACFNQC